MSLINKAIILFFSHIIMIYITKQTKDFFEINEESLWQSIVSDIVSFLMIVALGGIYTLFAIYVGRSWVFEIIVGLLVVLFFFSTFLDPGTITKDLTKEQLLKKLEEDLKP